MYARRAASLLQDDVANIGPAALSERTDDRGLMAQDVFCDAPWRVAHAGVGRFLALYLTTWYAPGVDEASDAALLFYGGSMLVASARGYAGCEVLAVSNWLLRRNDQIGCAPFWPIDALEARYAAGKAPVTDGAGREC